MVVAVKHDPSAAELDALGVRDWPIWEKGVSRFPWSYDEEETCYLLEGDVVVTPDGEEPLAIGKGDLVTFPAGLTCTWEIRVAVRKRYRFG
ncbi:MAG: cupin domain-containing protein [Polyangiaceae bacterium]|nr:cupin domain-containing protein [Polyangiaceae bacterium]